MGLVVQSLNHLHPSEGAKIDVTKGGFNCPRDIMSQPDKLKKLAMSSKANLDAGSKICPILNDGRKVADGIAQSKYPKAVLDAGLLSLYAIPGGCFGANKGIANGIVTA